MVLVEADAVIAELVHLLPGFEMLGIGAHRDVGLEVAIGERIGELAADLEMLELFAIGEQVEDENLHDVLPVMDRFDEVTAGAPGPPRRAGKFHICGNADICQKMRLFQPPQSLGAGRPAKRSAIQATASSAAFAPAKPW